jgi:hypothetical protein
MMGDTLIHGLESSGTESTVFVGKFETSPKHFLLLVTEVGHQPNETLIRVLRGWV